MLEEFDSSARKDYKAVVSHRKTFFREPTAVVCGFSEAFHLPSRTRRAVWHIRQSDLVRAATSGQNAATQKERVFEEFIVWLRGDILYFVKLDNPVTYEQAVAKA